MQNSIKNVALQTLEKELAALEKLRQSIDDDFEAAIKAIAASSGRLVLTGIGKSALIAKKIVATLNSTGSPALFMHAADAIHGDLGMIQSDDIAICISKSGETPEIKVLAPMLKTLGNRLIAIVAKQDSFLAKQADYCLWTPIDLEADPNNLAPTASTTSQMVMGDMLAMALMSIRGFSPEDFARFHPGGALGKQLYLKVADLIESDRVPAVNQDATVRATILEITSKRYGATAVLDDTGSIVGIITDGDIRRMMENHDDTIALKARDIMNAAPKSIQCTEMAVEALHEMRLLSISQIIVLDGSKYLGMVHLHDMIKEGII